WSFSVLFETGSIINIFISSNGRHFSRFGAWYFQRFTCCAPIAAPFSAAPLSLRSQSPIFVPGFVFPSRYSLQRQFCSDFSPKLRCKESRPPSVITSPRANDLSALSRSCGSCPRYHYPLGRIFHFPARPPFSRLCRLVWPSDDFHRHVLCRASVLHCLGSPVDLLLRRRALAFL